MISKLEAATTLTPTAGDYDVASTTHVNQPSMLSFSWPPLNGELILKLPAARH
jgi:hypothetical protein